MIDDATERVKAAASAIEQAVASQSAPDAPAPGILEAMGTSTRFAMFVALGLFLGVNMATQAMRPVIVQRVDAPLPPKKIPGPGYAAIHTCCATLPPDPKAAKKIRP